MSLLIYILGVLLTVICLAAGAAYEESISGDGNNMFQKIIKDVFNGTSNPLKEPFIIVIIFGLGWPVCVPILLFLGFMYLIYGGTCYAISKLLVNIRNKKKMNPTEERKI
jgi:hypothetical protein